MLVKVSYVKRRFFQGYLLHSASGDRLYQSSDVFKVKEVIDVNGYDVIECPINTLNVFFPIKNH